MTSGTLLILGVAAVGVLHTLVPDHWTPIVVVGRQRGWSPAEAARAAALAGFGHVTSTLAFGLIVWAVGATIAARFSHAVNLAAGAALIGFGAWVAYSAWNEARGARDHDHRGHAHLHRHGDGTEHVHWHEHHALHVTPSGVAVLHEHAHSVAGRTALVLILGSSPMFEGLPAFLAASTHGAALVVVLALVFAAATIGTYVVTSVTALAGLRRLSLGPLERYGEVLSGLIVVLIGISSLATA